MSKWNGNKFSVYTSEEKTVLGLLDELGSQVNHNTDNLKNKTDLYGDHKGSWQGLSRPTMSEEGMRATVEDIIDNKIPSLHSSLETLKHDNTDIHSIAKTTILNRDNFWDVDAKNGNENNYHSRNIVLLGDSHSWGEGSPNYQGLSNGYNPHKEWLLNDGYMGRLSKYIRKKWNSEPWRCLPNGYGNEGELINVEGDKSAIRKDNDTYTKQLKVVDGSYSIIKVKGVNNKFNSAIVQNDIYSSHTYFQNAHIGLFEQEFLEIKPYNNKSCVIGEMETPSRFIVLNLLGHRDCNVCNIELMDKIQNFDFPLMQGFGSPFYGFEVPKVYDSIDDFINGVESEYYSYSNGVIKIDCALFNGERNFIIDMKQKKNGTVRLTLEKADKSIDTRGMLFTNLDMVKNWALGGHSLGAMLGEEDSFTNERRNHIDDIKKYMNLPVNMLILQVPIVNEYLNQTPLNTFKERLNKLVFGSGLNNNGKAIIFNTIGGKNEEFGGSSLPISYDDYDIALKEWVNINKNSVTFIDCRKQLKDLVKGNIINKDNLFINNNHPNALANELIYNMLKNTIDYCI